MVRGGEDLNGWSGLPSESFWNSLALVREGCGYPTEPEAVSAVIVCAGNCAEGRHRAGLIPVPSSRDIFQWKTFGAALAASTGDGFNDQRKESEIGKNAT